MLSRRYNAPLPFQGIRSAIHADLFKITLDALLEKEVSMFYDNKKPENTPNNIRALRESCGLTLKECAEIFGIPIRTWQKREEPIDSVSHVKLDKIHFEYLLLLADRHHKYWLKSKGEITKIEVNNNLPYAAVGAYYVRKDGVFPPTTNPNENNNARGYIDHHKKNKYSLKIDRLTAEQLIKLSAFIEGL